MEDILQISVWWLVWSKLQDWIELNISISYYIYIEEVKKYKLVVSVMLKCKSIINYKIELEHHYKFGILVRIMGLLLNQCKDINHQYSY